MQKAPLECKSRSAFLLYLILVNAQTILLSVKKMKTQSKSDYSDYSSMSAKSPSSKTFHLLYLDETMIAQKLFQERYRQAKLSFNIAVGLTGAISIFSILVALSVCTGNIPAATATTVMGLTSGVISRRLLDLSIDANRRLDETTREFLDE
jgi:hypothetical protein